MHAFPILNLSKSSSLRVTVASLPRPLDIPFLPCYKSEHSCEGRTGRRDRRVEREAEGKDDDDDDEREFKYAYVNPRRERDQRSGEELKKERRQQHDQRRWRSKGGSSVADKPEELIQHKKSACTQTLKVLLPEPKDVTTYYSESVQYVQRLSKLKDISPQHVRRFPLKPKSYDNLPPRPSSGEFDEKQVTAHTAKLKCQQEPTKGKRTPTYELYYASGQPRFSTVELERRIGELKLQKQERSPGGSSPGGSQECLTSTPPPSQGESTPRPICAWRDRTPSLEEDDGIFFTAKSSLEDRGVILQDFQRMLHKYDKDDEDVPATEFGTPLSTVPWLSYHKPSEVDLGNQGNQGHIHCESQAESVHGFSGTDTPPLTSLTQPNSSNSCHQTSEMQSQCRPSAIAGADSTSNNSTPSKTNESTGHRTTSQSQWTADQVQGPYSVKSCHNAPGSSSAVSGSNTPSPMSSPCHSRRRGFSLDGHDFQANIPAPFRKPMQYEGNTENASASSPFTPVFGKSKSLFRSVLGKENNSWGKEVCAYNQR